MENAKRMSLIFKDRPMSALDIAVYWVEYVIKHRGARHLRSAAVDLPWYQYYLLDVVAFVLSVLTFVACICYFITKRFIKIIIDHLSTGKLKTV